MNDLISGVAVVATKEKSILDECEMLLASVAALQVRVMIYDLRINYTRKISQAYT